MAVPCCTHRRNRRPAVGQGIGDLGTGESGITIPGRIDGTSSDQHPTVRQESRGVVVPGLVHRRCWRPVCALGGRHRRSAEYQCGGAQDQATHAR